jgi:membrane protease YdiL (CAAX protease family)
METRSLSLNQKIFYGSEFFLISLFPVALLYFKVFPEGTFPLRNNISILIITFLIACTIVWTRVRTKQWSFSSIGFQGMDFFKALPWYTTGVLAGMLLIFYQGWRLLGDRFMPKEPTDYETIFLYSMLGSVMQEFLYRCYLFQLGRAVFPLVVNVVLNIALFVAMHFIYPNYVPIMSIIIPGGVIFSLLYLKYPNFLLISVTHMIFNILSIHVGFFK